MTATEIESSLSKPTFQQALQLATRPGDAAVLYQFVEKRIDAALPIEAAKIVADTFGDDMTAIDKVLTDSAQQNMQGNIPRLVHLLSCWYLALCLPVVH